MSENDDRLFNQVLLYKNLANSIASLAKDVVLESLLSILSLLI